MNSIKKIVVCTIMLVTCFSFAPSAFAKVYKMSNIVTTEHPEHQALLWFVKELKKQAKLRVKIYPNAVLGSATTTIQMTQNGTLAFAVVGGTMMGNFSAKYKVLALPYLYKNKTEENKILYGPIGEKILTSSEKDGFIGLAFLDAGSRNFYTKKPIHSPKDLKGMKIRVLSSPILIDTMKALGATPVPIPYSEIYSALQQGVVDGAENNIPSYYSSRHYEVTKFFTEDHHASVPDIMVVSTEIWKKFTKKQQVIIKKLARQLSQVHIKHWDAYTKTARQKLIKQHIKFIQPDLAPFQKTVQPVYVKFKKENPKLVPILNEILKSNK